MNDDYYLLDELVKIFQDHCEKFNKSMHEFLKNWIENNPDKPIPNELSDDFSFPKALLSIVKELQALKNEK